MGQIAIVNGRVSDELLRNSLVTQICPQNSTPNQSTNDNTVGGKATLSRDSFPFSIDGIDLSHVPNLNNESFSGSIVLGTFTSPDPRKNEGRTLVDNPQMGITLTTRDPSTFGVRSPDYARWMAKTTHAFLYQTTEWLTDAASLVEIIHQAIRLPCSKALILSSLKWQTKSNREKLPTSIR